MYQKQQQESVCSVEGTLGEVEAGVKNMSNFTPRKQAV